jgi:hypothetical protein
MILSTKVHSPKDFYTQKLPVDCGTLKNRRMFLLKQPQNKRQA